MVTATVEQLVNSMVVIDDTQRDLSINAARTLITAHLQLSTLVDESDSERMKMGIALMARNHIINLRNSRQDTTEVTDLITDEVRSYIETDEDTVTVINHSSSHSSPSTSQNWRNTS